MEAASLLSLCGPGSFAEFTQNGFALHGIFAIQLTRVLDFEILTLGADLDGKANFATFDSAFEWRFAELPFVVTGQVFALLFKGKGRIAAARLGFNRSVPDSRDIYRVAGSSRRSRWRRTSRGAIFLALGRPGARGKAAEIG